MPWHAGQKGTLIGAATPSWNTMDHWGGIKRHIHAWPHRNQRPQCIAARPVAWSHLGVVVTRSFAATVKGMLTCTVRGFMIFDMLREWPQQEKHTHTHTHTHTHPHTYTHVHTRTHTYTHVHTRTHQGQKQMTQRKRSTRSRETNFVDFRHQGREINFQT